MVQNAKLTGTDGYRFRLLHAIVLKINEKGTKTENRQNR